MNNYCYERYGPPDEWGEPTMQPRYQCSDCEQTEQTLDIVKEYFTAVIDMLYSRYPLDKGLLEYNLDQICAILEVKMDMGELQIQRPQKTHIQPIIDWKVYNQNYLKQLSLGE